MCGQGEVGVVDLLVIGDKMVRFYIISEGLWNAEEIHESDFSGHV